MPTNSQLHTDAVLCLDGEEIVDVLYGRFLPDEPLPETAPVAVDGDVAREVGGSRVWRLADLDAWTRGQLERAVEDDEAPPARWCCSSPGTCHH